MFVIISGMDLNDPNRGTAALGYGAVSFIKEKGFLNNDDTLLQINTPFKFWKYHDNECIENIQGAKYRVKTVYLFKPIYDLYIKFGVLLPFCGIKKIIKSIKVVAAINGGDGFSDIYNTTTFRFRLRETLLANRNKIPVIILPQTLGPFSDYSNYKIAKEILESADKVYVRDDKFVSELQKMGVKYEIEKDLSSYMQPEPFNIDIKPDSIGLNISGLCYSNTFRALSGRFSFYPELIIEIIKYFQKQRKTIYLIPHSYCFSKPEDSNDDIIACRAAYDSLIDKSNVYLVDMDLISPQVKYIISKMSFFCGTRMHSNFAAIYTGVPLFGLAYSYKFEGAFSAHGLDANKQIALINNIQKEDIPEIIKKIDLYYTSVQK